MARSRDNHDIRLLDDDDDYYPVDKSIFNPADRYMSNISRTPYFDTQAQEVVHERRVHISRTSRTTISHSPLLNTQPKYCNHEIEMQYSQARDIEPDTSASGGFLARTSASPRRSRRGRSTHDDLDGSCFTMTGFIHTNAAYVEITHMLIDSGASSTLISREAVRQAGLRAVPCEPRLFSTCNGPVYRRAITTFSLFIAGVSKEVTAYVDDTPSANEHHILLGTPAMRQFDMQSNHCFGRKQETRWSISHNTPGNRRKRFVLQADSLDGRSTIRVRSHRLGGRRARHPGETARQRYVRERRARLREEARRAEEDFARECHPELDYESSQEEPGFEDEGVVVEAVEQHWLPSDDLLCY